MKKLKKRKHCQKIYKEEKRPNDRTHLKRQRLVKEYFRERSGKDKGRGRLDYFSQIMNGICDVGLFRSEK